MYCGENQHMHWASEGDGCRKADMLLSTAWPLLLLLKGPSRYVSCIMLHCACNICLRARYNYLYHYAYGHSFSGGKALGCVGILVLLQVDWLTG